MNVSYTNVKHKRSYNLRKNPLTNTNLERKKIYC